MSYNLTPLEVCEWLVAPIEQLGRIAGTQDKAPYNWRKESKYRAAGDMPPHVNRKILEHAERKGIPLEAEFLIRGAKADQVLKILEETSFAHKVAKFKLWLRERGEGVQSVAAE